MKLGEWIFTLVIIAILMTVAATAQNTIGTWNNDFHWDDPDNPVGTVTYNFYESTTSGGPWTLVNTVPIVASPFNYPGRTVGNFYAVSAVVDGGLEALSDELQLRVARKPVLLRLFQVIVTFLKDLFGWWA